MAAREACCSDVFPELLRGARSVVRGQPPRPPFRVHSTLSAESTLTLHSPSPGSERSRVPVPAQCWPTWDPSVLPEGSSFIDLSRISSKVNSGLFSLNSLSLSPSVGIGPHVLKAFSAFACLSDTSSSSVGILPCHSPARLIPSPGCTHAIQHLQAKAY